MYMEGDKTLLAPVPGVLLYSALHIEVNHHCEGLQTKILQSDDVRASKVPLCPYFPRYHTKTLWRVSIHLVQYKNLLLLKQVSFVLVTDNVPLWFTHVNHFPNGLATTAPSAAK